MMQLSLYLNALCFLVSSSAVGAFSAKVGFHVAVTKCKSSCSSSSLEMAETDDEGESVVDSSVAIADDNDDNTAAISKLKRDLLQLGASYDRGFGASPRARRTVDEVIENLESLNAESNASEGITGDDLDESISPLSGSWRMIWTTASDVVSLGASPIATIGAIYQIFEPPIVTNVIDFIPRIQSVLPPSIAPSTLVRAKVQTRAFKRSESLNRIGLNFESVKLQPVDILGQDVSSLLPPLGFDLPQIPSTLYDQDAGPGYFDVTYLDDDIVIIRQNAPGGLFVLYKVDDAEP